jgi:hypothetical protein
VLSDGAMRDRSIGAGGAIGHGLGRLLPLLGASLLYFLGMLVLFALAVPLFVVTVFGVLGSVVAVIGLLVWFGSPGSRQPWLKWLIILATPFGLPIYFADRWALWVPAAVLERAGPMAALERSNSLVRGHWFKVFGVIFVVGLIVAILQQIVGGIIAFVGAIAFGSEPVGRSGGVSVGYVGTQVVSTLANVAGSIVFGGIAFIAPTVLYRDLRNRNEGADLAEQVATLEQPGPTETYDLGGTQPIR